MDLLIRGLCMNCLKDSLLTIVRDQGTVGHPQGPTDKEIHMTDIMNTDPDITEVPAEAVAPAPHEAPYVAPPTEPATDVDAEPAPAADTTAAEPVKAPRRARTELESRVKAVTDAFVSGSVPLGDGEALTPHRIAKRLEDEPGNEGKVSTGAVASVLSRWEAYGFAKLTPKPLAFVDYTDEGREEGLTALKEAATKAKREQKAAIKAAEAPATPEAS